MRKAVSRSLVAVPAIAGLALAGYGSTATSAAGPGAAALRHGMGGPPQASPPASQQPGQQPAQPQAGAGDLIATVVDGLVEDRTLTTAQGEAVTQALSQIASGGHGARAPPDGSGGTT